MPYEVNEINHTIMYNLLAINGFEKIKMRKLI